MNKIIGLGVAVLLMSVTGCGNKPASSEAGMESGLKGQSAVQDSDSRPDIVKVAVGSPDHTTLVAALKAADYVDVLTNVGPFTVFAPTNAAFAKLPAGTVETLVKKENQDKLRTILEYHVYVGMLRPNLLSDGMTLGQASGHNASIKMEGDVMYINDAKVLGSIETSNGMIYVVDSVLLPPSN